MLKELQNFEMFLHRSTPKAKVKVRNMFRESLYAGFLNTRHWVSFTEDNKEPITSGKVKETRHTDEQSMTWRRKQIIQGRKGNTKTKMKIKKCKTF